MLYLNRLTLAATLALLAGQAFALNLNDAVNAASTLQNGNQNGASVTAAPKAAGLLNTLGSQLKVTPEQAVGGTGAMLGLAKNKLSSAQYGELTQKVPGLDQLAGANALGGASGLSGMLGQAGNSTALNNALGNVNSTSDVNSAFGQLGMNSGMVSQFAPVILQYLGQQGTSGSTLQSLASIWGVKG
ncbi:DUF2780 domain-containing protein [Pseudomonas typographi]|uniref:DUF2780 domain-containing protein n=1 Tax=Pseudomonas typographi TaxID=2715964 RepID=A0ABR7YVQ6_9PSED|nr:DUF2780 domain-containing protein [Pseudomonas typographi]MBD1552197.1 DUF2780 domain-containing protein [Pseudomonas typographi]MBD1585169.1 DUF2780 domain-containing protein [Pseudomonas typographi]MBD1597216.1 DUF2780 domain-containing protein [Pseudomonas typographi]